MKPRGSEKQKIEILWHRKQELPANQCRPICPWFDRLIEDNFYLQSKLLHIPIMQCWQLSFFLNTQSENIEINTKLFLEKGQNNIIHFSWLSMKVQVFRMPILKMKEWFELKLEIPVQNHNTDISICIIKSGKKRLLTIKL